MKRHAGLLRLSREHHGALKLARDSRRAAESGEAEGIRQAARRIADAFSAELDAHFREEESGVLALLAQRGEHGLVRRALSEHEEMRRLAAALDHPDDATLQSFAELMAAHVRFEERELFEVAQALLDEEGLERPGARPLLFS